MKKFLLLCFAFVFVSFTSGAQDRVITGKVTSADDGSTLPGVNVVLKGTTTGTTTDADGMYSLSVPSSGGILVFTFIGMAGQEATIGERSVIDVSLVSDITQLSEVVVTALGAETQKRALGYSITSVSGSQTAARAESDVARLLIGKVPGVNITSTGGVSGTGTNIVVRGYSTISGSNQPLFVVDGVPFNTASNAQGSFAAGGLGTSSRFLDLDPNNVESISVLKGLAAAVLYGEQGKKGVILVTTKNGSKKSRNFEVQVAQSMFMNKIASIPTFQNNYGNGFDQNFGFFFSNWGPKFRNGSTKPGVYGPDFVQHPYDRFADATLLAAFPQYDGAQYEYKAYRDPSHFFRTGSISNTSVNIGGSKDNTSYNANFTYTDEEGFTPGNTLNKFNAGVGINSNVTKKFGINVTMNLAVTAMETPPLSTGGGSGPSGSGIAIFSDIMYTPRSVDLFGLPFETPNDHRSVYYRSGNDIQNPLWTAKYTKQTDAVTRFYGQSSFTYSITDDLNLVYRLGIDTYSGFQEYWSNKGGVQGVISQQGVYRTVNLKNDIWNHDLIASYNKKLSQDFSLDVTLGGQYRLDKYTQDGMESTNQVVFGLINHNNFVNHASTSFSGAQLQFEEENIRLGAYGQATVGFRDYLYLNLAGRNDWSSTLEKANRSLFYPSASLSFVPTTAFNMQSETLNFLKFRLGYGTSAGFPPPYSTRSTLYSDARAFQDINGNVLTVNAASARLGNPDLKPELQQEFEVGAEAQLIKNRLGVDVTFYNRNVQDLITDAPLDPATGYGVTRINIGKLNNKGAEIALTGTPIKLGNGLQWNVTLNWSAYRSVVKELGSGLSQIQIAGFTDPGNYAIVDQPFNVMQGSRIKRLNGQYVVASTGDWLADDAIGYIGNPNPKWVSSIINEVSWKGLTLAAQIDYRYGGDIYSSTARALLARGISKDTDFDRDQTVILPGVLEDGTPNNIQTSIGSAFFNNIGFGPSEVSVYDGTTIRLREVSLSYNLPKSILSKVKIKNATIKILGQNLWYKAVNFPKYVNFDTDVLSTGVGNGLGLELLTGPTSRRYGATLSITL